MVQQQQRRDRENREELAQRIASKFRKDGVLEPFEGLRLTRNSQPTDKIYAVSRPSLCIIAQGIKEIYLGDSRYQYDPENYLLATVELPVTGRVIKASNEQPYLSLRLDLEPSLVGSVMVEAAIPAPHGQNDAKAVVVDSLDSDLLDATVRLIRLLDKPSGLEVLAPLVKREIIYLLLTGKQGARLRHVPRLGSDPHRIARAIEHLRKHYDQPLRVESLARELGMSPSGFHHHFKAVTDLSPLQFQKHLRLQEARRMLLDGSIDAATAGYKVGYEDPSYFSRDYKRHFGHSPMRDIERLRKMA